MLTTRMDSFPRAVEIATDGIFTENNSKSLPLPNFPKVRLLVGKQLPAGEQHCVWFALGSNSSYKDSELFALFFFGRCV